MGTRWDWIASAMLALAAAAWAQDVGGDSLEIKEQDFCLRLAPEWKLRSKAMAGVRHWLVGPGDSLQLFLRESAPYDPPLQSIDDFKACAAAFGEGMAGSGAKVLGFRALTLGDGGLAATLEFQKHSGNQEFRGAEILIFHPKQLHRLSLRSAPGKTHRLLPEVRRVLAGWAFSDAGAPHRPSAADDSIDTDAAFTELGLSLRLPATWEAQGQPEEGVAARFTRAGGISLDVWGATSDLSLEDYLDALAKEMGDLSKRSFLENAALRTYMVRPGSPQGPSDRWIAVIDLGKRKACLEFSCPPEEEPYFADVIRAIALSARPWTEPR